MTAKNSQLSEHFQLSEFLESNKASELGIDNTNVTEMQIMRMQLLCDNILEPLRKHFNKPVKIISGWRCKELNDALPGSSSTSQHMRGEAADIAVATVPHVEVFNFILTHLSFDQLIAEKLKKDDPFAGWVHVSFTQGKRRQEAISYLGAGRYVKGLEFAP